MFILFLYLYKKYIIYIFIFRNNLDHNLLIHIGVRLFTDVRIMTVILVAQSKMGPRARVSKLNLCGSAKL